MPNSDMVDDVVVMEFGFVVQHRSFPMGEREGDRGHIAHAIQSVRL